MIQNEPKIIGYRIYVCSSKRLQGLQCFSYSNNNNNNNNNMNFMVRNLLELLKLLKLVLSRSIVEITVIVAKRMLCLYLYISNVKIRMLLL
jgi:hypothetical protein